MRIVADQEISFVDHYFAQGGEVILKPGRTLTRGDLVEADVLIARSVTLINQSLLHGTRVRFVGSPVTGIDHIDTAWLDQHKIRWATAKGCNTQAVVEYVVCVIAALQTQRLLLGKNLRAGVVGVGNIGSRVVDILKLLGFEVVYCDPIRAENEAGFSSVTLDHFADLDFITLHTPLTKEGRYPTFHMIDQAFLQRQKPGCVLLNTGRGSVINFEDLKKFGRHCYWCLDVWEHEPTIDKEVLDYCLLSTPHIAGHSIQSKYRGIEMIYRAACQMDIIPQGSVVPLAYPRTEISSAGTVSWQEVVLKAFDPLHYTLQMKTSSKTFDQLRKEGKDRHEFEFIGIQGVDMTADNKKLLLQLKFS
jgi:erythronate-4-phosphate dehydrogenase